MVIPSYCFIKYHITSCSPPLILLLLFDFDFYHSCTALLTPYFYIIIDFNYCFFVYFSPTLAMQTMIISHLNFNSYDEVKLLSIYLGLTLSPMYQCYWQQEIHSTFPHDQIMVAIYVSLRKGSNRASLFNALTNLILWIIAMVWGFTALAYGIECFVTCIRDHLPILLQDIPKPFLEASLYTSNLSFPSGRVKTGGCRG